jgi:hypothetical protein
MKPSDKSDSYMLCRHTSMFVLSYADDLMLRSFVGHASPAKSNGFSTRLGSQTLVAHLFQLRCVDDTRVEVFDFNKRLELQF